MTSSLVRADDCPSILLRTLDYQKSLTRILNKIRNSVSLRGLCATTSQDVARLLNTERVVLYKFEDDWSGRFVNEYGYADSPWDRIEAFGSNLVWEDTYLQENQGGRYRNRDPYAVSDIYEAGHARCHIEMLEQFQVRAYVIAPIFVGQQLWGLIAAYHHSAPRLWDKYEVAFLAQAADHLGIAIQHNDQRKETAQRTVELQSSIERQRSLIDVVSKIRSSLDTPFVFKTACQELCKLLQVERAAVYQFNQDYSGQFVCNFGSNSPWGGANPFDQAQVWEDSHLQETQGGRYRNNEIFAVDDIYEAGHARCHLDMLEQYKIRAYAIAPIFINNQLWGLLSIYHHLAPHNWQAHETEFLTQVAAQIGVAIQQSKLLDNSNRQAIALEKSVVRQRALTEVVSKVRSSLDTALIFNTTCQEVSQLLEIDRVAIYRFNEDWSGQFLSHFGRLNPEPEGLIPFGQNTVWEDTHLQETKGGRYRNNETLAVDDIRQENYAKCHQDVLEQYKIRAYTIAPIFVGQQLWGLLAGYQHTAPRQWEKTEVDFLAQVASQLGVAIQSASALQESQTRAGDMGQAVQRRQILFDVVAKIRASLDLDTIFETTTKEIRRFLNVDRAGIFQFDIAANYNQGKYIAEDVGPQINSAIDVMLEDHCFGENYVADYANGRMMVISDIRAVNFQECHIDFLEQLQIKAQLVVPLMKGPELWGLLCVHQCDRTRDWTDSEVDFIKQVAAQLSVALLQSTLLSRTKQQAEQLSNTVKELQSAQLQVIQSEKMASLGQLVAGVAHEINNPINFIHGNLIHAREYSTELLSVVEAYQQAYPVPAAVVSEQLADIDTEFIQNDLPNIFRSMQVGTERIREIVTSLRNFSRLDESDTKVVDIHEGIDSTLMILQNRIKASPDLPGIQVVKDYDSLPEVSCYPGQLNQVFMNLLANAIDALDERDQARSQQAIQEEPSQITISTMAVQTDWVAIHISDNGAGIPQNVLESVFDPFFTTKGVGKGTGLGLSISYQIVTEKHHGKLYCHSSPNQGTEFVIEIPIQQPDEIS
ncbi:MAG: GAF domain-containing protein [Cyanobacteria bacterium J06649_5]